MGKCECIVQIFLFFKSLYLFFILQCYLFHASFPLKARFLYVRVGNACIHLCVLGLQAKHALAKRLYFHAHKTTLVLQCHALPWGTWMGCCTCDVCVHMHKCEPTLKGIGGLPMDCIGVFHTIQIPLCGGMTFQIMWLGKQIFFSCSLSKYQWVDSQCHPELHTHPFGRA